MTHQGIFKQAVEKAVTNGWEIPPTHKNLVAHLEGGWAIAYRTIIYDPDFARALWGDNTVTYGLEVGKGEYERLIHKLAAWKYHLQLMVVADDPIEYLGKNLE